MTRCPSCGGLVGAGAEWCGQCFTRLDTGRPRDGPAPDGDGADGSPPPAGGEASPERAGEARQPPATGSRAVRSTEEGIVWDCPACGQANPIESHTCSMCGTPFARLFADPDARPEVEPGRAATASLIFPGAGHYVAGRKAEGVARGTVFLFALAIGLVGMVAALRTGSPVFIVVMALSLGAAGVLYVLSTVDAGRAVQGLPPMVSTRTLLSGAVGLMLASLVLLTVATMQVTPRSG